MPGDDKQTQGSAKVKPARVETFFITGRTPGGADYYVVRYPGQTHLTSILLMPPNAYERNFAEKVLAAAKQLIPHSIFEMVPAGYEDALMEPRTW